MEEKVASKEGLALNGGGICMNFLHSLDHVHRVVPPCAVQNTKQNIQQGASVRYQVELSIMKFISVSLLKTFKDLQ